MLNKKLLMYVGMTAIVGNLILTNLVYATPIEDSSSMIRQMGNEKNEENFSLADSSYLENTQVAEEMSTQETLTDANVGQNDVEKKDTESSSSTTLSITNENESTNLEGEEQSETTFTGRATKASNTGYWGNVPWSFDNKTGILIFTGGGTFSSYTSSPWNTSAAYKVESTAIKQIVFTTAVSAPVDSYLLFGSLGELTNFVNLTYLKTDNVVNMRDIFAFNPKLTELDLSSFNTQKTTNMQGLFFLAKSLRKLYLQSFDTSSVTNMAYTFQGLDNLYLLSLGGKSDFSKTSLSSGVSGISSGNAGDWVNNADPSVNMGKNDVIFKNYQANPHPGVYTRSSTPLWGDVPWSFDSTTGVVTLLSSGTLDINDKAPWRRTDGLGIASTVVKKIVFTEDVQAPSNSFRLFGELPELLNFENMNHLKTDNVTNMRDMFAYDFKLTELDLSSFNTKSTTNMQGIFYLARKLRKLYIQSFDTSSATNMAYTFQGLDSLYLLSLGEKSDFAKASFTTGNTGDWVNNADLSLNMGKNEVFFKNYQTNRQPGIYVRSSAPLWGDVPWSFDAATGTVKLLTSGQLGTYQTAPWNRPDAAAISPDKIKKIQFSDRTQAPKDSSYLFSSSSKGLFSLSAIDNLSLLDTHLIISAQGMFQGASRLTSLDLSSFQTAQMTDMSNLFANTSAIKSLDLSNFDTRQANVTHLFANMTGLLSLTLGANFRDSSFVSNLPLASQDTNYSQNWKKQDGETVGIASVWLKSFDGSQPGVYTRELATDPIVPESPIQTSLVLKNVPSKASFSTKLQRNEYTLTQNLNNENVTVYNDRLSRDWTVKAQVVDNQLTLHSNTSYHFSVTSFSINGKAVGTGQQGVIIAQAQSLKTLENNTGTILTPIKTIGLTFRDDAGKIKAKDKLSGTINYQLYNTPTAE